MLNLLLVEDDIDLATAVIDYLELEEIQCDHAANGLIGLNLIEKNSYQAIILDLNLPQMSGLTVCESMRNKFMPRKIISISEHHFKVGVILIMGMVRIADKKDIFSGKMSMDI